MTDNIAQGAALEVIDSRNARPHIRQMAEVRPLSREELDERKIIHAATQNREALNAFRELRTVMLQRAGKQNFVVLVSGVSPQSGASFMSLNLAAAFALDHAKTSLLVDCNLYEPSVDRLLYVEPEYGLTEYLENPELEVDDIIYASGIPRMRIIPAGHSYMTGAEFYASARMESFMHSVRQRYADRYIVIDAPPLGSSAESRILADLVDFVLLVVPYGKVTQDQINAALEAVPEEKLIGMVFNNG